MGLAQLAGRLGGLHKPLASAGRSALAGIGDSALRSYKSKETKEGNLDLRLPFPRVRAYNLLKLATELYLMQECGVFNFCDQNHQQANTDFHERFDEQGEANRLGRDLTTENICDIKKRYLVE